VTGAPGIEASEVTKSYGDATAVRSASLVVDRGELVALLGPSGSGKTTLLRVIAGLEAPDAGMVSIGGRSVVGPGVWVEPEARRVGMVFQDGALFPHLNVADNVAFGRPAAGRVQACLELVGLADRGRSYAHELSGGERQRVALARALAPEPDVVLLDEPFASLDATLRGSLRADVVRILHDAEATALLVTHDQQEALSLADRVVVMRDGAVAQSGAPQDVYDRPASRWIAEFLGAATVLPGVAAGGTVECGLGRLPAETPLEGPVDVVIRPEHLRLADLDGGTAAITATVVQTAYYGHDHLVDVELPDGQRLQSRGPGAVRWEPGQVVTLSVDGAVTVMAP